VAECLWKLPSNLPVVRPQFLRERGPTSLTDAVERRARLLPAPLGQERVNGQSSGGSRRLYCKETRKPTTLASRHADVLLCGSPSPGWACARGKQK
jgi:hypothetical protein